MKKRNKYNKTLEICPKGKIRESIRKNTLFVEGINDNNIFESIISNNWNVSIYNISKNKKGQKENIVDDFKNKYIPNHIAIVDKDYDNNDYIKNLYYTDYNDIETTAIKLMDLTEIYDSLKLMNIAKIDFEENILKPVVLICEKFSRLWFYFKNNNIDGQFLLNNPNYYPFLNLMIDVEKNSVDYNKLNEIYKQKFNIRGIDYESIMNNYNNKCFFRGHDFFKVLLFYLKKKNIKTYILNDANIERSFIENSVEYFWIKRSDLYNDIQSKNGCFK